MAKLQSISWTGKTIEIVYGNGKKFAGDCGELPESIFVDCPAARHGITQKLGDAKSGGTAQEKYEEVLEIWGNLKGGSWNRRGNSGNLEELVERAYEILAETAGQPATQAGVWYKGYQEAGEEKQAEIRAKGFMKAALDTARAEKKLSANTTGGAAFNPNE
jgi:hypothetical protein